jgi:hypothetical protein
MIKARRNETIKIDMFLWSSTPLWSILEDPFDGKDDQGPVLIGSEGITPSQTSSRSSLPFITHTAMVDPGRSFDAFLAIRGQ